MKIRTRQFASAALCLSLSALCAPPHVGAQRRARGADAAGPTSAREEAYRANNLGVALLEQFRHADGAEQFRRALRLDPRLALARINLAIALFNIPEAEEARREAEASAALAPRAPQPHYILGLIARAQNRPEDALASFRRVLEVDARDVGALVNAGQLLAQQRKYTEAIEAFRAALSEEPYNGTALYNLGTALLRAGQREEGQTIIERFQTLRQSGAATVIGPNYLEQGRYAEAIASTGAEPDLFDPATPRVSFTDATARALPQAAAVGRAGRTPVATSPREGAPERSLAQALGGGVTLFDFDGDGDLDLFEATHESQRLRRNDGSRLVDVTSRAGALAERAEGIGVGSLAGDYNNDGRPDLFVLRNGALRLYRNEGRGLFADVSAPAGIPAYPHLSTSATFFDADHDGDLDIFVAGFAASAADAARPSRPGAGRGVPGDAPNLLLRNNGDGTFKDFTAAAGLAAKGNAVAVVATDYDNRRDVDLLVVYHDKPPALYRNLRDGTFRDVAAEAGLRFDQTGLTSAAAGDVNKDGFTDFYFARRASPGLFAMSDGKGRFNIVDAPQRPAVGAGAKPLERHAAQFLDYDNDGLLDLVAVAVNDTSGELSVWRNTGQGWADVSAPAARALFGAASGAGPAPRVLASGDVDADGDTDLFLRREGGPVLFARNEGGNRRGAVRVRLAGKVSNRSGVGAKVEMRAGSLSQKLETYSAVPAPAPADVSFGLGGRARADAVRVLWPAGIVQAETEMSAAAGGAAVARGRAGAVSNVTVTELDRKPSSCPYLYTWNGERFEFVTDFLGGGELGYWLGPGVRSVPDTDEYVRVRGEQLRPRGGRYEIRVTNELEEVLFLDRLRLIAVDHPEGVEVYPNEGLGNSTGPAFKLYATRGARPPAAARDEHGHDVSARIAHVDRRYPDDFALHTIRGYASEHALQLDLGRVDASARTLLLLTGWTDYAFSSDNVAAAQSGRSLRPPALQVRDAGGGWKTVIEDIGVPVGRPQTVVVDLAGKLPAGAREVRVVTNMRVYWDQVLVDTSGGDFPTRLTTLEPASAELRWRGFSEEVTPDGREPFGYDYARVSPASPWKVMPGRYTREGDVLPLLVGVDDLFVVARPGDEAAVSFDAAQLPALPTGWARTFLIYADGFSKEMDLNSASPDQVAPLPFHGMRNYPYGPEESYPQTPAHRDYVERYNTRLVAAPVAKMIR